MLHASELVVYDGREEVVRHERPTMWRRTNRTARGGERMPASRLTSFFPAPHRTFTDHHLS